MASRIVPQRLETIHQYYQRTDEKVLSLYNRPYIYFSPAEMDGFVDETTAQ
jgi:hypothetical protein